MDGEQLRIVEQLKAEWKRRHAERTAERSSKRPLCEACGLRYTNFKRHEKLFWHRECDKILMKLQEGQSQTEVAASYGRTRGWLHNHLRRTIYYRCRSIRKRNSAA